MAARFPPLDDGLVADFARLTNQCSPVRTKRLRLKLAILVFDIYHANCAKKRIVDLGKFVHRIGLRGYWFVFRFSEGFQCEKQIKKAVVSVHRFVCGAVEDAGKLPQLLSCLPNRGLY